MKTKPKVKDKIELAAVIEWVAGQWARDQLGLPSEWRQNHWMNYEQVNEHCATTCCVAGRAALMAGYIPALTVLEPDIAPYGAEPYQGHDVYVEGDHVVKPGEDPFDKENWLNVRTLAIQLMGLHEDHVEQLFEGNLDIEDILRNAREILSEMAEEE